MTGEEFEIILDAQIKRVRDVLVIKAEEYADIDRLANFRTVASMRGISLEEAIAGMMVKHTVSIYDMIDSKQTFALAKWDEKITDHINYLILLRAAVEDRGINA